MSNFDRRLPDGWKLWPTPEDRADDTTPNEPPKVERVSNECSPNVPTSIEQVLVEPRWKRELDQITGVAPVKTRSIPLKTLVPLLLHAERSDRAWLRDFAEDVVTIDADLHDVLVAYGKMQSSTGKEKAA